VKLTDNEKRKWADVIQNEATSLPDSNWISDDGETFPLEEQAIEHNILCEAVNRVIDGQLDLTDLTSVMAAIYRNQHGID